jgi:hypothetical protein
VKNLQNWARLSCAVLDARNALRNLIPQLDRAIAAADTSVLLEIRALAIQQADALRLALKHPAPSARRSAVARRSIGI